MKRILAILLMLNLLLALAACGNHADTESRSLPTTEGASESAVSAGDGYTRYPTPEDYLDVSGVDFSKPDIVISYGDYDGMVKLAKSIQNYELEGVVVEIDGEMGMSMMSHTVVMPNVDRSESMGTTFRVIGMEDKDYPGEDSRVHLTGIVRPLSEYVHGIVVPAEHFSAEPIDGLNPAAIVDTFPGNWESWGSFDLLVPEGMSARLGELNGEELPTSLWLELNENPAHYFLFTLTDEQTAIASIEAAKEINEDAQAVTLHGNSEWTGWAYQYMGMADCFQIYGQVDGQYVLVSSMWFNWDDEMTHAVLDSIEITGESDLSSSDIWVYTPEHWNPYVPQRQVILDSGAICGAAFLGTVDPEATNLFLDRDYYEMVFGEGRVTEVFKFLSEIPDDYFAYTPLGQELYLIVPLDENASVSVNSLMRDDELHQMVVKDVIYKSETGAPFLVRCNDGFSWDSQVVIIDSEGNTVTWMPQLDENGSLNTQANDGKLILDITPYDLINPSGAVG